MKNNITNIIKQIKIKTFSYGKFFSNNYRTTKEERIAAIKQFLETTRNSKDKN